MPNLPESLLTLIAGRPRAAAIVGDLAEMAATRGRLWFWTAYARTLLSLSWRVVLALLVADIARELIFQLAGAYMRHAPATWRTSDAPQVLGSMGPLLACVMSTLWFALPFAAVRYGLRDRFVQFTFAIAVGTTVTFLFIPWASLVCAALTLTLAIAALASNTWRKPSEVLLWTGAAGLMTIAASAAVGGQWLRSRAVLPRSLNGLVFGASLLVVALDCSRLHKRLLERPSSEDRTLA